VLRRVIWCYSALFDLSTVTTQLRGLRTVVYGGDDHEAHRAAFASLWFNKICSFVDGGSATRNDQLRMLGAICEARNGLSPPWTGVFYAVAVGDPRTSLSLRLRLCARNCRLFELQ